MFKILLGILFSISASAALYDVDKQQLLPENLLVNGGFENSKAAWTASGGTLAIATSGSNLLIGKGSATWDSSGAAQTLSYSAITIPKGYYSRNGVAKCTIMTPSGTATHTLQAYDGTNVLSSSTIMSSTSPVVQSVNFVIPASGTVTIRVVSVAADEPSITVDECYLGLANNVNLVKPQDSFSAFVTGNSPAPVTGENTDWISGDCVRNSTGDYTCTFVTGLFSVAPNCQVSASNGQQVISSISATSINYVTLNSTGSLTNSNAYLSCQKASTDAPTYAYSPDTTAMSWSGYHDNTCSWARTNTAYGDPATDASCALVERTNSNFGTVSSSGSVLPNIVFTPKRAGRYYVCANVQAANNTLSAFNGLRLWDGTTVVAETGQTQATSGSGAHEFLLCGIYSASSTTAVTLSVQSKASSGQITIGQPSLTSGIEWSIYAISQNIPSPLLVNSLVSKSIPVMGVESALISCNGSSSVTINNGSWVSSVGNIAGGNCAVNITAGTFSSAPVCVAMVLDDISGDPAILGNAGVNPTTSVVNLDCAHNTGTDCTAFSASLICIGPR